MIATAWSLITTLASWLPASVLIAIAATAIVSGLLSGGITRAATVLLTVAALSGWGGWQVNAWRGQTKDTQRLEAQLKAERAARADEMVRVRNLERINDAQTQREAKMLADAAAARRAVASLRNKIAQLNARDLPPDPRAAALAIEANTARNLLGECSDRYRSVDERARALGNQVTGLQAFATEVCKAGQP